MIRAALLTLLLAAPVWADLIPSGMRGISHDIQFEGMEKFPETTFVLYPGGMGRGVLAIKAGESMYWKWSNPKVFAVKGELPGNSAEEAFFANPSLPRSDFALPRTGLVEEDDPRGRIQTVYTIEAIEGAVVKLSKVEQVFDVDGKLLSAAPAPAESNPDASPADELSLAGGSLNDPPADASPTDASPADASPADASPADASPTKGGGLCTLRPGRSLPLLGLSALALCGLVLAGLRRSD